MILGNPSLTLILINFLGSPLTVLWGQPTNPTVNHLDRVSNNDLFRLLLLGDFLLNFLNQFRHIVLTISSLLLAITAALLFLLSFLVDLFLLLEERIVITVRLAPRCNRFLVNYCFHLLLVDIDSFFLLFFLCFFA